MTRFNSALYQIPTDRTRVMLPAEFVRRGFCFNRRGALVLPNNDEWTAAQLEGLWLTRQYVWELERQLRTPTQWPLL